jgi:hypothetical protein
VFEHDALARDAVEDGSAGDRVAERAGVRPTPVVREHEQDIGSRRAGGDERGGGRKEQGE